MSKNKLVGHKGGVVYAVFSDSDSKIVSGDDEGNVFVWRDNGDGEWRGNGPEVNGIPQA